MFFLPAIIFCFVNLRGKHCTVSRGEEAAHSLPWPQSVSWQLSLGPLPMGFPIAEPFLWGPVTGLVQLLPQDAQSLLSLCTAWEIFRSCLPSDISAVVSLLWWGELRVSSQPQRCSLWWSCHPPPAGCLAWHAAAVSQLAPPPTSSPAPGGETLVAQGRGEQEQQCRGYVCSWVPGYLSQILDCNLIKPKFS